MFKKGMALLIILLMIPCTILAEDQTLQSGSSGARVRELQQRLNALGLEVGNADGIYGSRTASAVQQAQQLLMDAGYSLIVSGKADPETYALLFDPEAESALLTLQKGSKGEAVKALQTRLIDLKLLNGNADGDFGSATEAAVKAFQQKMTELGVNNLAQDGIASPTVVQLLMSDLSQYGFRAPVYFCKDDPLSLTADHLYAAACILIDAPSGKVLFEHRADETMYPASTTKMMTLLLALEEGGLEKTITIPKSAKDVPADSSLVPVSPGEQMTMEDLLHGLMIRSGNDAANAVAELCAGSVDDFVDKMNLRAEALGLSGTHFENPHGYHHENHYSTARDLAALARLGLTDAAFCQIVTTLNYTLPATEKRDALLLQNSYAIFDPDTDFYIPGAAGVKSGYTSAAGFCYVGACQRDGETLIAVILGVPGRDRGWADLQKLFEYGFALSQQTGPVT